LVGERGIGEAVANDPFAGRERRSNHGIEVAGARREHQQGLDLGRQSAVFPVEYPRADRLAQRSAPGLARRNRFDPARLEMREDQREVGRFADAPLRLPT
jgi:hypothetical protein